MPRKRKRKQGAGIKDIIRKVANFVQKNKIISRAGKALGDAGVPYAGRVGEVAGHLGYGRKRRRRRK